MPELKALVQNCPVTQLYIDIFTNVHTKRKLHLGSGQSHRGCSAQDSSEMNGCHGFHREEHTLLGLTQ